MVLCRCRGVLEIAFARTSKLCLARFVQTPYRISCIISTYDDADHLEKKLAEIQKQTIFQEVEFLFVETASPGHERDIIEPVTLEYPNIRLLVTDDRRTLYQAWNLGWEAASADLVCYSNMDDALHPECLQRVVEEMEARPELDLCSVMIAHQYENSPGNANSFDPERLKKLRIGRRPGPFSAWRKSISEKIGMFDGEYQIIGDMDFWARATQAKLTATLIHKVLYLYTIASSQLSKRKDKTPERNYAAEKGVTLRWHPKVENAMLLHRKLYRIFASPYLIK